MRHYLSQSLEWCGLRMVIRRRLGQEDLSGTCGSPWTRLTPLFPLPGLCPSLVLLGNKHMEGAVARPWCAPCFMGGDCRISRVRVTLLSLSSCHALFQFIVHAQHMWLWNV